MSRKLKTFDAMMILVVEASRNTTSISGYKRALRAVKALNLSESETNQVMSTLDYVRGDGTPYMWVQAALSKVEAK